MFLDAGLPDGVLNISWARSRRGRDLVTDALAGCRFTGSTASAAGHGARLAHVKRLTSSWGHTPIDHLDDADLDAPSPRGRVVFPTWQICHAVNRLYVARALADDSRSASSRRRPAKAGPGSSRARIRAVINEKQVAADRVTREDAVGRRRPPAWGGSADATALRAFYQPTVLADVPDEADMPRDLRAGGAIVSFASLDESSVGPTTRIRLVAYVFGKDLGSAAIAEHWSLVESASTSTMSRTGIQLAAWKEPHPAAKNGPKGWGVSRPKHIRIRLGA